MITSPDDDAVDSQASSTSFDPYGQLVKMMLPRASCIAIYDRLSTPLWVSDGCEGPDLMHVAQEALATARRNDLGLEEYDGFAREGDGETIYLFLLRDGDNLLGALALSCQDSSAGARPFSLLQGLLRPALQALARELVNQYSLVDLRRDLQSRDGDLQLLLEASDAAEQSDGDDFEQLVQKFTIKLDCVMGALLIPGKNIEFTCSGAERLRSTAELLEKTRRHLFAWMQVQRRTLMLNKAPANSPLGALACKILACPIRHDAQQIDGVLLFFRAQNRPDFHLREARIIELMARRIARVLQNSFDATTGLLTRSAFEQHALSTLSAVQASHCVAYADVDRLHVVNENHGMHVGDHVIVRIAEIIRAHTPPHVYASRISGDRFALFLPNCAVDAAKGFAQQLCDAIAAAPCEHEGQSIGLSVSFGVSAVPSTRLPLSHALATAEVACKAAKDRGRGRVEVYQEEDRSIVRRYEDVAVLGRLREAIANDQFRMEAQPIVQFGGKGPPRRFELLLRMIDATGASITPDKFLSAAERYQLATEIDRWVVQYALEMISSAAPALEHVGAHFAINISGQSLGDDHFPDFLEAKLREYALPPGLLSFEITETAAVANIVRAETLIHRLQNLGHAIALDDFGKGLSSLTYLKSLPVSHLKIDGGLVRDLVGNARAQAMVSAIVQLSRSMRLTTTAECVESEALLHAVGDLGVDYGQGFAIGRPRALELVLQDLLKSAPGVIQTSGSPRMARLAS